MKNKSKIISSILMIVGVILIVVCSIVASGYKRGNESYYHSVEFMRGVLEVRTQKDIDVDNAYVTIFNEIFNREETVKLEYAETSGDNYVFYIQKTDYKLVSIEIKDNDGNEIELSKYTEQQEKTRDGKRLVMFILIGAGVLTLFAGVGVIIVSFAAKTVKVVGDKIKESEIFDFNPNKKIKCEYCGFENNPEKSKCESCGANLQSKKKSKN